MHNTCPTSSIYEYKETKTYFNKYISQSIYKYKIYHKKYVNDLRAQLGGKERDCKIMLEVASVGLILGESKNLYISESGYG